MITLLKALTDLHTKDPVKIIEKLYTFYEKVLNASQEEVAALYSTLESVKETSPHFEENQKKALKRIDTLIELRMREIIRGVSAGPGRNERSLFFHNLTEGKISHPYPNSNHPDY